MKVPTVNLGKALLAVLAVAAMLGFVAGTALAADPVTVSVAVTGDAVPGATVTAKATLTINDGSTLQSIAWTQVGGPQAQLTGADTDTVTVTLASREAYRDNLVEVLQEPPIGPEDLPPNVPPLTQYYGGLQNRYGVVGVNNLSLEDAGAVKFNIRVVTTSGTYDLPAEIATTLPWTTATGLNNVPVALPAIIHGVDQASYDWTLTLPEGSAATLVDATTQNPEFTPDVPGTYKLKVTDLASGQQITVKVVAGLWRGVIVGQDQNGRPEVDTACTGCHAVGTILDYFTPWKNTGHAEIFTQNIDAGSHYTESCLTCHTVGFNLDASNNGFDDQPDFQAFLDSGMLENIAPDNWTNMLAQFPKTAKLANIQCENCHGPQNSEAHVVGDDLRVSLSADVCGSCHGEPARHGRFQQWQISSHANYEVAESEGMNGTCAVCHTANGFVAWIKGGFTGTSVDVTWTADEIHPQTCQACHDPHDIGTTSGYPNNAKVRIMGDTPMLQAGFVATDLGRGAVCATCHNSRRGLRNDTTYDPASAAQAPHVGTQADILMGQNLYFVQTGTRSYHSRVTDACANCHMEETPPPAALSYQLGGTNHTFFASKTICSKCHSKIVASDVQGPVESKLETLKAAVEGAILDAMKAQITAGKKIDLGGQKTVTSGADLVSVDFGDTHGQQGITVGLSDGSSVGPITMTTVKVVPAAGSSVPLYSVMDQSVPKAAWNYLTVETDGSLGVHNPTFVNQALDVAIFAAQNANPNPGAVAGNPGAGGGPGNGAGAVSCTSPYVYWAEIAAHLTGDSNSHWQTDMVARNLASSDASLTFILHTDSGDHQATSTVPGSGMGVFEDLVAMLGVEGKGALEVCSDKPLLVAGRIFNQTDAGTYGQYLDGHVADLGLTAGETASLIGLHQETGKARTNISVTNGGTTPAEVQITLYDAAGNALKTYSLTVDAGKVVQDLQPFKVRANMPDVGWGFATVTVLSGSNVLTSASVIDDVTNDPITIPAKQ